MVVVELVLELGRRGTGRGRENIRGFLESGVFVDALPVDEEAEGVGGFELGAVVDPLEAGLCAKRRQTVVEDGGCLGAWFDRGAGFEGAGEDFCCWGHGGEARRARGSFWIV